jgi:RNA polymerase sigma factor (TIGR02999 family)
MMEAPGGTTVLLKKLKDGDPAAKERLAEVVYDELRRIAKRYMQRERAGHTLQATVLVHEAFLKLVNEKERSWHNRAHFIATAAHVMRRFLVDYARKHNAVKRSVVDQHSTSLRAATAVALDSQVEEILALDGLLERLKALDFRQYQIVELRYFGGLTVEETAEALGVSAETVKKDWASARAWLFGQLNAKREV